MNKTLINRGFGIGLMNAMFRRATNKQIITAILPCRSGDGATTVVKQLIKSVRKTNYRIAVLDLNVIDPSKSLVEGVVREDLAPLFDRENTDEVRCPDNGIFYAGVSDGEQELAMELGIPEINALLERFKNNFSLIIIDGPALLSTNLSEIISLCVNQTYLVVRQETTAHFQVNHAIDRLKRLGVKASGIILNDRRLPIPSFVHRLFFRRGRS